MKRFHFHSNQFTGWIERPAQWRTLLRAYTGINGNTEATARSSVLEARRHPDRSHRFGFYLEYDGETLREYAEREGFLSELS